MRTKLQARIIALRNKTDTRLRKSEASHKHDCDRRVREKQAFHTEEVVLIDKPRPSNVSDSWSETLAQKPYTKLQFKRTVAFCNLGLQKTIVIDKDGIQSTRPLIEKLTRHL